MTIPPNLQTAASNVNTSGTANTQVTQTLLAAPGAGIRYRIWAMGIGFALSSFTGTKLIGLFAAQTSTQRATLDCSLGQPSAWQELPGGIAIPTNTAFQCTHSCDVATQSIFMHVWYTQETG